MFFRRKGWLRKEFDEKLLKQLDQFKEHWNRQKTLVEKSFDPSDQFICSAKIEEAKYFYLIREAKARNTKVQK